MTDEAKAPQAVAQFLTSAADLAHKVHGLAQLVRQNATPADAGLLLRIVKPLWVTAENLLPELNHLLDFWQQDEVPDEQSIKLRRLIEDLDEDLSCLAAFVAQLEQEKATDKIEPIIPSAGTQ